MGNLTFSYFFLILTIILLSRSLALLTRRQEDHFESPLQKVRTNAKTANELRIGALDVRSSSSGLEKTSEDQNHVGNGHSSKRLSIPRLLNKKHFSAANSLPKMEGAKALNSHEPATRFKESETENEPNLKSRSLQRDELRHKDSTSHNELNTIYSRLSEAGVNPRHFKEAMPTHQISSGLKHQSQPKGWNQLGLLYNTKSRRVPRRLFLRRRKKFQPAATGFFLIQRMKTMLPIGEINFQVNSSGNDIIKFHKRSGPKRIGPDRVPKGVRPFDVPQIECPLGADGEERFACPGPDRRGRYRCIEERALCDGFADCPAAQDEDLHHCMFYRTTKAHLDVLADALLRWARGRA